MTSTPSLPPAGQRLAAAGHYVVPCGYCGVSVASDVDHSGHQHNAPRRYCSIEHRRAAARLRQAFGRPEPTTRVRQRPPSPVQLSIDDLLPPDDSFPDQCL